MLSISFIHFWEWIKIKKLLKQSIFISSTSHSFKMQKKQILTLTALIAANLIAHPVAFAGKNRQSRPLHPSEAIFEMGGFIAAIAYKLIQQLLPDPNAHQHQEQNFSNDAAFHRILEAMKHRIGIRQALALDIIDFILTNGRATFFDGYITLDNFLKYCEGDDLQAEILELIQAVQAIDRKDGEIAAHQIQSIADDFIDHDFFETIVEIYLNNIAVCLTQQTDYMAHAVEMARVYREDQPDPALAGIRLVDIIDYRGNKLVEITRSYRLNITAIEDFIRGYFDDEQGIEHLAESIYDQLLAELNGRQFLKPMKSQRYAELKIDKKPRIFVYRDGNRFVLIGASLKDDDKTDATDKKNANKHLDKYLKDKR